MKRKPLTEEAVTQILALGDRHPPAKIADLVGRSPLLVTRVLRAHGFSPLPAGQTLPPEAPPLAEEPPRLTALTDGERHAMQLDRLREMLAQFRPDPIAVAKDVWGERLRVTDGGYWLNGKQVYGGLNELIRRTNAVLRGWGLPLLTACPAWLSI